MQKKNKVHRRTDDKALQRIWHDYEKTHGTTINDPDDVAQWAIDNGLFDRKPPTTKEICKKALTRAIRNEYVTDPNQRVVRLMHAVPKIFGGQQVWEWGRLYTIPPDGVRISLQRRRNQAKSECRQIRNDNESYNDFNEFGAQIPLLDFNIQRDLEEERLAGESGDGTDHDD